MSWNLKTPTGWIDVNEVKDGDELASIDGDPSFVTRVFPKGIGRTYCTTFSDGRSIEVSGHQLWEVRFVHEYAEGHGSDLHNGAHCFTTDSIRTFCLNGSHRNGHRKVYVPLVSGDFGAGASLPIHPWLLGVLLGDGGLTRNTPILTTADEALINRVATMVEPFGLRVVPITSKQTHRYGYRLSGDSVGRGRTNALMKQLEHLGLRGLDSSAKFIPTSYLNAQKHSRWELLRGLLDTDGTRGWSDEVSFSSTSLRLAEGVQHIVRSLGGLSAIYGPKRKWYYNGGEKRQGLPAFYVSVRLPEREKAFSLERKAASRRQHQPRLTVEKIEPVGAQSSISIHVSHPSGLFIADGFVLMHS